MVFNRGSTCGACFEVRCVDHIRWCLQGSPSVVLTATDFCPPNYGLSADYGGWCNFPKHHFEMSEAAFAQIAKTKADIVPIQYRRCCLFKKINFNFLIPTHRKTIIYFYANSGQGYECRVKCERIGGIRFRVTGSSYFYQVLISNVGLDGEVVGVKVKGSRTGWIAMARNWGQNWHCNADLKGQPLSFEVTLSSGLTVTSYNAAPSTWRFGQVFQGKQFQSTNPEWDESFKKVMEEDNCRTKELLFGPSPLI